MIVNQERNRNHPETSDFSILVRSHVDRLIATLQEICVKIRLDRPQRRQIGSDRLLLCSFESSEVVELVGLW